MGLLDELVANYGPRGLLATLAEEEGVPQANAVFRDFAPGAVNASTGVRSTEGGMGRLGQAIATMPSVESARETFTAPARVMRGELRAPQSYGPETPDAQAEPMIEAGFGLAGTAMAGGVGGTGAGGMAVGAGPLRPAIRYNGKVYKAPVGSRDHIDAFEAIPDQQIRDRATWDRDTRGFVDESGKYYDRRRAQQYALKEDLIDPKAPSWARTAPELISENLAPVSLKTKAPESKSRLTADDDALLAELTESPSRKDTTLGSGSTDKRGAAAMGGLLGALNEKGAAQALPRGKSLDDLVRLYHGTSEDAADAIRNAGELRGPAYFAPTKRAAGDYGETVLDFMVPRKELRIDLDLPGGQMLNVDEANQYLGRSGWTIDDYIGSGQAVGLPDGHAFKRDKAASMAQQAATVE